MPEPIVRATYSGPLTQLQGEEALVELIPNSNGMLKAQFDNEVYHPVRGKRLDTGWHRFLVNHFTFKSLNNQD